MNVILFVCFFFFSFFFPFLSFFVFQLPCQLISYCRWSGLSDRHWMQHMFSDRGGLRAASGSGWAASSRSASLHEQQHPSAAPWQVGNTSPHSRSPCWFTVDVYLYMSLCLSVVVVVDDDVAVACGSMRAAAAVPWAVLQRYRCTHTAASFTRSLSLQTEGHWETQLPRMDVPPWALGSSSRWWTVYAEQHARTLSYARAHRLC